MNDYFSYYGYEITLMSGTPDYVEVIIDGRKKHYKSEYIRFSFDFWTKKLDFSVPESVKNTDDLWRCMLADVLKAFKTFYRGVKADKRTTLIYKNYRAS